MGDGAAPMQGLQNQQQHPNLQQQLTALLAAATAVSSDSAAAIGVSSSSSSSDDSSRAAALEKLHRLLFQPQTVPILRRSSPRLCQTLQQLVSDKAYVVRQAAAIAYGALGGVAAGVSTASNGRPGSGSSGAATDRFMAWALSQITDAARGNEATVLALGGLREFFTAGDPTATERFVPAILKACQALLEDEIPLLEPLLEVLMVLGKRFSPSVQTHFADIVDLLLGQVLDPELSEADRGLITNSFLEFQTLWAESLSFSLDLLLKFLGDMEALAQDTPATLQQLRRLLALVSCFVSVLQATASGLQVAVSEQQMTASSRHSCLPDEIDKLSLMANTTKEMLPRVLASLTTVGQKFADYKWTNEAFRCLAIFAAILKEGFAEYYLSALDILLQGLATETMSGSEQRSASQGLAGPTVTSALTSTQICSLLQVNLQLISSQSLKLPAEAVSKLLDGCSHFASLRLHPSRVVTGTIAATYVLLVQHASDQVSSEATRCLTQELESFKEILSKDRKHPKRAFSDSDVYSLFKFDLMVLLGSVFLKQTNAAGVSQADKKMLVPDIIERVEPTVSKVMQLKRFILTKLNPFQDPLQWHPNLQLGLLQALRKLGPNISINDAYMCKVPGEGHTEIDCNLIISHALQARASLPVKLEALEWISSSVEDDSQVQVHKKRGETGQGSGLGSDLLRMLLSAASNQEPQVRAHVASVLELLLQAKMVKPLQFQSIAMVALEQLGDSEPTVQAAFQRVFWAYSPAALWTHGWFGNAKAGESHGITECTAGDCRQRHLLHWKQAFAVKRFAQHLRVQQLVWILNYLSQRGQTLPTNWLHRLIHNCPGKSRSASTWRAPGEGEKQEPGMSDDKVSSVGEECTCGETAVLEAACVVNNVAAAWWAVQEASRHCITVRLRTHLGGPTQTFAALERMLLDVPQICQTDGGQRDGVGSSTVSSSSSFQLLPMRLLLEFVESLKKNMFNAYEGSAVLPSAPSSSTLFFRSNRKVCEEWFARIREASMNASAAIQFHAGTYHHASHRLQDLRGLAGTALREFRPQQLSDSSPSLKTKVQQDVSRLMRHASLALCRLHEDDTLSGLQVWVLSTFGSLLNDEGLPVQIGSNPGPFAWMTGLTCQARGQYERAAAHYTHLLQEEQTMAAMGAEGIQFTIARTIESFVAIGDWESLDMWLQELQLLRSKHAGKAYSGALTTAGNDMNAIHALARFDAGDPAGAWGYLDLTPQSSSELTADPRQALLRSEQMLLQAMLRPDTKKEEIASEIAVAKAMIEDGCQVAVLDGLTEAAASIVQMECIQVFEAFRFAGRSGEKWLVSALPQTLGSPLDPWHQDSLLWLKLLRVYRAVSPGTPVTLQLHQQLIRLARKQCNLRLARRLLHEISNSKTPSLEDQMEISDHHSSLSASLRYERILLLHAEEKHEDALVDLWHFCESQIRGSIELSLSGRDGDLTIAKACLKLSTWLQCKPLQVSLQSMLAKVGLHQNVSDDMEAADTNDAAARVSLGRVANTEFSTLLQEIIGAGTKSATLICPSMAKAWFSYASWCYDFASGLFSGSNKASSTSPVFGELLKEELSANRSSLTNEEVASVQRILENAVLRSSSTSLEALDPNSRQQMEAFAQIVIHTMEAAAGAAGSEDSDGDPPSFQFAQQLQEGLQMLPSIPPINSFLSDLMPIWWALRYRRVSMFGHAARGFLQYLAMSNHGCSKGCSLERVKPERGDFRLRASLYVLRILLNYGVELEESLQQGLAAVPPSPWQAITAQLFAHLSTHPEPRVRKQVEGLLMASAHLSPWAIVYPTLVDVNACEGEPPEELQHLIGCLANLHPKVVRDVKVMIAELGAITVLWDEQWLSTLQDLHADVMRRITTLREEAARVAENATLTQAEKLRINAAKYSAMMAPVAVALERRLASTSRPPETPDEVFFQEQFGSQLKAAISIFKSPPVGPASLADVWRPFDALTTALASHRKKSTTSLKDISPALAVLESSDAPMPGLEVHTTMVSSEMPKISVDLGVPASRSGLPGIVTVAAFGAHVTILATKTKPKKLQMVGSDGCHYPYLLKGREDLRLDARIMQLLQAVNGMLRACSATRRRGLAVRHYSVTPISGCAGLIRWVDNLTSMYSVYKAWQQRTQAAQLATAPGNAQFPLPSIPRPSDLFYGKIIPALKEKGLRRVISRRDWPQEVKRKVLIELMKETPRQLLHRELWCASEGVSALRLKMEHFSGSVAVMSIVGYILGLGDRHLDNILVDFSSGDIVHIDYNVCFDKGLRLKIPEIVPFRLTHTIQAALGLTGVEGIFRGNCEAVLEALKRNKDVILMLLQVFVWDPLVEWMRGDGHDEAAIGGEERKGMELAVSLSLFASRVQEIRVPLQEHHDQLLTILPTVQIALETLKDAQDRHEKATLAFAQAEQSRSAAAKGESAARVKVVEGTSAVEKARGVYEVQAREFGQAKALVTEAARESIQWFDQHRRILDALSSGSLPEVQAIGQLPSAAEALSLTSAVVTTGVPLAIVPEPAQARCREVDREVAQLTAARHEALLHAVQTLQAYSLALQHLLPVTYVTSSHVHAWAQVLQVAVQQPSPDVLAVARRQAAELLARARGDHDDSVRQNYEVLRAHVERLVQGVHKLQEDHSELEASIDPEAEHKAKDRLLAIFTSYMQPLQESSETTGIEGSKEREDTLRVDHEKQHIVVDVLNAAARAMYKEIGEKVEVLCSHVMERTTLESADENVTGRPSWCLPELREMMETCVLVSDLVREIQQTGGRATQQGNKPGAPGWWDSTIGSVSGWARYCTEGMAGVEDLCKQMVGVVLPEAIKAAFSHDPAVMQAVGALSHIQGAVETVHEELVRIRAQHSKLKEFEVNYPVKVEEISQRQALLEVAAANGREHLSWEEAEELASQEEDCCKQLEDLHQAWTHREAKFSSLQQNESATHAALFAAEQRFESLVAIDRDGDLHLMRGTVLLAAFARLFAALESLDRQLGSLWVEVSSELPSALVDGSNLDSRVGSYPLLETVWKAPYLLQDKTFFVWKVGMMDALLNSCIWDVSSTVQLSVNTEQVLEVQKKRLEAQLQWYLDQYLRERLAPVLLACLKKEKQFLTPISGEYGEEDVQLHRMYEGDLLKRAVQLLHEYCDVHETVRAARKAASSMKLQVEELMQALQNAHMEAARMEWLNESTLSSSLPQSQFLGIPSSFRGEKQGSNIAWWNRQQVLDNLRAAISAITRATEGLQGCEMAGSSVEEQLDRAMAWACVGTSPNSTVGGGSSRVIGIPTEFHEHLRRRRQLLWTGQEQAANILRLSGAVLEFEDSREGFLSSAAGRHLELSNSINEAGRVWQHTYHNMVARLESACLSFTNSETEWQSAQKSIEAANLCLSSALDELNLVSAEATTLSGEVQTALSDLREQTMEAATAVSAFTKVVRGHTALTLDSGQMLEEVLAITQGAEGADDVHSVAQEASAEHAQLMADLSKVNGLLLLLEPLLASAAAFVMRPAWGFSQGVVETEGSTEGSSAQAHSIFHSLHLNLREAVPSMADSIPRLLNSVKHLHVCLMKLVRTASSDAGVLHKALEGVGESQEQKSQEILIGSSSNVDHIVTSPDDNVNGFLDQVTEMGPPVSNSLDEDPLLEDDDDGWISPPESGLTGESDVCTTTEASSQTYIRSSQKITSRPGSWHTAEVERNRMELLGRGSLSPGLTGVEAAGSTASPSSSNHHPEAGSDLTSAVSSQANVTSPENLNTGTSQRHEGTASSSSLQQSEGILSSIPAVVGGTQQDQGGADANLQGPLSNSHLSKRKLESNSAGYNYDASPILRANLNNQSHTVRGLLPLRTCGVSSAMSQIEKNAYAVSVLKRVQSKLEGRDIDGSRQFSVTEQVDYLLRQATSIDNLSNMYEGWTPWI